MMLLLPRPAVWARQFLFLYRCLFAADSPCAVGSFLFLSLNTLRFRFAFL